jgi:hypothetical protein
LTTLAEEPPITRDGVVEWLESPDGRKWSRNHHKVSRHQTRLIAVKEDTFVGEVHTGEINSPLWVCEPSAIYASLGY